MDWERNGNQVSSGDYDISRAKHVRDWRITYRGVYIGSAPILYLAKQDAEAYSEKVRRCHGTK